MCVLHLTLHAHHYCKFTGVMEQISALIIHVYAPPTIGDAAQSAVFLLIPSFVKPYSNKFLVLLALGITLFYNLILSVLTLGKYIFELILIRFIVYFTL